MTLSRPVGGDVGLVVTTIGGPNAVMTALAEGSRANNWRFYVIGDRKGPEAFDCPGVVFFSLERQRSLDLAFARACPTNHYARKNIGYLLAALDGACIIVETDDDNMPEDQFWRARTLRKSVRVADNVGWINVYRYFSESQIWPRGLPLDGVNGKIKDYDELTVSELDCPI